MNNNMLLCCFTRERQGRRVHGGATARHRPACPEHDRVTEAEFAQRFDVATETIRRDPTRWPVSTPLPRARGAVPATGSGSPSRPSRSGRRPLRGEAPIAHAALSLLRGGGGGGGGGVRGEPSCSTPDPHGAPRRDPGPGALTRWSPTPPHRLRAGNRQVADIHSGGRVRGLTRPRSARPPCRRCATPRRRRSSGQRLQRLPRLLHPRPSEAAVKRRWSRARTWSSCWRTPRRPCRPPVRFARPDDGLLITARPSRSDNNALTNLESGGHRMIAHSRKPQPRQDGDPRRPLTRVGAPRRPSPSRVPARASTSPASCRRRPGRPGAPARGPSDPSSPPSRDRPAHEAVRDRGVRTNLTQTEATGHHKSMSPAPPTHGAGRGVQRTRARRRARAYWVVPPARSPRGPSLVRAPRHRAATARLPVAVDTSDAPQQALSMPPRRGVRHHQPNSDEIAQLPGGDARNSRQPTPRRPRQCQPPAPSWTRIAAGPRHPRPPVPPRTAEGAWYAPAPTSPSGHSGSRDSSSRGTSSGGQGREP
jgi:hypothetical protein